MSDEPIIVVLGPRCGGTSAVAGVLHHLGVFMGSEFAVLYRELGDSYEELGLHQLCRRAFSEPGDRLQMDPEWLRTVLRTWAGRQRHAARAAGRRPGAKDPALCLAVDVIRATWDPIVPVVVERPVEKIVASLNRLGWLPDEQERVASTARLITARDVALARTPTVGVDFEALRATPAAVIRRLAQDLGLDVTQPQLQAAVDSVVTPRDVPSEISPFQRIIDQLLPEVQRDPADPRSVSMLAQVYFDSGDFANARTWFARRIEIDGHPDEDLFLARFRLAQSMEELGTPWGEVQDAYLRAWDFRPTRAEPLYHVARHQFNEKHFRLGYLFAERAAAIPRPEDLILPYPDIYTWRAADVLARSAFCVGEHTEAFQLWRRLLARPDIPDDDRQRIATYRDQAVPAMLEAVSGYPDPLRCTFIGVQDAAEVTVTLTAGPDLAATELALNSFLNCCTDIEQAGRFLVLDAGLPAADRAVLQQRYGFLEFAELGTTNPRAHIYGRFWLHLGQNWQFFAPEDLITRLTAVLVAEAQVFQVAVNLADAATLTGVSAPESVVHRAFGAGRYVLSETVADGPAMFDTARFDAAADLHSASLDEVLCITGAGH